MFVETLTKRRRLIPEINSNVFQLRNSSERMAINMPIQGTAADVIKIAMININKEVIQQKMLSRMIIQVHDELMIEIDGSTNKSNLGANSILAVSLATARA